MYAGQNGHNQWTVDLKQALASKKAYMGILQKWEKNLVPCYHPYWRKSGVSSKHKKKESNAVQNLME